MAKKKNIDSKEQLKNYLSDLYVEKKEFKSDVIPTGVLSLDVSTGIGGIPCGRFTEISGPDGVGKTTLALHIVSGAIKKNIKVLYIDVENEVDLNLSYKIIGSKIYDTDVFLKVSPKLM